MAALAFCRLLERWARGDAEPSTPPRRTLALRRSAERVASALASVERPLGRYLLELRPERAEGRSWFGEPGPAELVDWQPVLSRAGVNVPPTASPRLPRARRARSGRSRGSRRRCTTTRAPTVTRSGRALRPARQPARSRPRRAAAARRLSPSRWRSSSPSSGRSTSISSRRSGVCRARAKRSWPSGSSATGAARAPTRRSRRRCSARACAWSARSAATPSRTSRSKA